MRALQWIHLSDASFFGIIEIGLPVIKPAQQRERIAPSQTQQQRRLRRMSEEIGDDHAEKFDDLRHRLEAEFNELVQRTEAHVS